jgi:hypothetical protein
MPTAGTRDLKTKTKKDAGNLSWNGQAMKNYFMKHWGKSKRTETGPKKTLGEILNDRDLDTEQKEKKVRELKAERRAPDREPRPWYLHLTVKCVRCDDTIGEVIGCRPKEDDEKVMGSICTGCDPNFEKFGGGVDEDEATMDRAIEDNIVTMQKDEEEYDVEKAEERSTWVREEREYRYDAYFEALIDEDCQRRNHMDQDEYVTYMRGCRRRGSRLPEDTYDSDEEIDVGRRPGVHDWLEKSEEEEELEKDIEKCESGEVGNYLADEMEEDPDFEKDWDTLQRIGMFDEMEDGHDEC